MAGWGPGGVDVDSSLILSIFSLVFNIMVLIWIYRNR